MESLQLGILPCNSSILLQLRTAPPTASHGDQEGGVRNNREAKQLSGNRVRVIDVLHRGCCHGLKQRQNNRTEWLTEQVTSLAFPVNGMFVLSVHKDRRPSCGWHHHSITSVNSVCREQDWKNRQVGFLYPPNGPPNPRVMILAHNSDNN